MRQPCDRNCPGRSPTCHAQCDKYQAYSAQQQEQYKQRKFEHDLACARVDAQRRMMRGK